MTAPAAGLIQLLDYIEQAERLKRSAAFTVPGEYFHAFEVEIGHLPGLTFNQAHDGDDIWLSLPRLGPIPPPEPAASLEPWIEISRSPDREPALRSEIVRSAAAGKVKLTLEAFPGVHRVYATYVEQEWTPWALTERPRRKAIALYNRLFALHQAIATGGAETPLELVWGMGVALWKRSADSPVLKFPLITQPCEVALNEQTFELAIRPRNVDPTLELDSYAELALPGVPALRTFWTEHLSSSTNRPSPFDTASVNPVLRAAVATLDANGRFLENAAADRLPDPGEHLVVSDTWVLFARRRSAHVLLEDLERLRADLQSVIEVPAALSAFVVPGDETVRERPRVHFRGLSSTSNEAEARDLYFPLPFNDEQVSIIEQLETSDGVVVQGPPGTGKTHTIANVICHFLAQGKRVLVSSKGESALAVIQEKVPEEIRPLTVALLSDERDGLKQFAHSVQTIAERIAAIRPGALESDIAEHERQVTLLHRKIASLDAKIDELAAHQLARVRNGEEEVAPGDLARHVVEHAKEFGWLTDPLDPDSQVTPQFADTDVAAIRAARLRLGPDLAYLGSNVPEASSLPSAEEVLALHRDLARAHKIEALVATGEVMPLIDGTPATVERAAKLRDLLRRNEALRADIAKDPFSWADRLRVRFEAREDPIARGLINAARSIALEELARRSRLTRPVEMPANAELIRDVVDAAERLADGKFGFLMPIGKGEARACLDAITVAGVKPAAAEDWRQVADELQHRLKARKLLASWNAMIGECHLEPVRESGVAGFRSLAARAEHVLKVHELVTRVEAPIRTEIHAVFSAAALAKHSEHDGSARQAALESLASHLDKEQLVQASARIRDVLVRLEGRSGAIIDRVWTFLTTGIGRSDTSAAESDVGTQWQQLVGELDRVASLSPDLATVERIAALVESSGARRWAQTLRTVPAAESNDTATPPNWRDAWSWRVAAMRLGSLEGHDTLKQLFQRRGTAEADLGRAYRALISDRAWLAVHNNSPTRVRQALQEYVNAMQAVGGGTGVRAIRHRQVARAAMQRAYKAVPCWILPHWRVSESMPPEIGLFDLVVIDEASQSDLWALPTLLRGKKLLIVGDHKQVSPSAVGIAEQKVQELSTRLLKDQPHGSQMTPDRSIYDLARVVFAGNSVMLREHFRSVPAIVEYSNREYYSGAIRPLRVPKASEKLEPPLVDIFVDGGRRVGDVNHGEANAIVEEVERIVADPAMAGRSVGIVTLLGHEQARLIDQMIRKRVSPRAIVAHRISTGAPATFQGRERDIVLLSMVLAPSDRAIATRAETAQRFNVAASRASNRMMLFRSVEENDFGADSLNARLIRHFREPFQDEPRSSENPRERCESDFEREIYDALTARGFRVQSQVRIAAFRVDFVVEGTGDRRLAIECDGERLHHPARWVTDMATQRVLERAGWTFWRCFASSFWLRKDNVLNDLFGTLEQLGIEPDETGTGSPGQWTERRVVKAEDAPIAKPVVAAPAAAAVIAALQELPPPPPLLTPAAPTLPSPPAPASVVPTRDESTHAPAPPQKVSAPASRPKRRTRTRR